MDDYKPDYELRAKLEKIVKHNLSSEGMDMGGVLEGLDALFQSEMAKEPYSQLCTFVIDTFAKGPEYTLSSKEIKGYEKAIWDILKFIEAQNNSTLTSKEGLVECRECHQKFKKGSEHFISEHNHGDGDYSYLCTSSYCRCKD